MYVRMALIITMLNLDTTPHCCTARLPGAACKNPNCITCTETYLPKKLYSAGQFSAECEFCNEAPADGTLNF